MSAVAAGLGVALIVQAIFNHLLARELRKLSEELVALSNAPRDWTDHFITIDLSASRSESNDAADND